MGIALRGSPEAKAALAAEIEQETVQTEDLERVNELLGGV